MQKNSQKNSTQKVVKKVNQKSPPQITEKIEKRVNEIPNAQNNENVDAVIFSEVNEEKDTITEKELGSWTLEKLKNITSIMDIGVIITIITSLSFAAIFVFKMTYMHIIGVPFELSISVVDITTIDLIITYLFLMFLIVVTITMYYCLFQADKKVRKKFYIGSVAIPVIIGVILNLTIYTCLALVFLFISILVFLRISMHFFKHRPQKLIKKILNYAPNSQQNIVAAYELILYIVLLCTFSGLIANLYPSIPTSKSIVIQDENKDGNGKVVICSSNSEKLTANYELIDDPYSKSQKKIKVNSDSFELVEKGNDPIKLKTIRNVTFESRETITSQYVHALFNK